MASGGYRAELNPVESFSFFWQHLWSSDTVRRPAIQIVDTILFHEGKPHWWLFTSVKTGEIMRKKAERLESTTSLIETFKKKSKSYKGYKTAELRSKIATVWYMTTNSAVSSYLVDDKEFASIITSQLPEILAVQVYMGGFSLKGNGIFEHKVWRLKNNGLFYQTNEYLDTVNPIGPTNNCLQLTAPCKKLVVMEQPAEILRKVSTYLVKYYESLCGADIESCSFLVMFNSTWDPYFINVKDITLTHLAVDFIDHYNEWIYFQGKAPQLITRNQIGNLLPPLQHSLGHDNWISPHDSYFPGNTGPAASAASSSVAGMSGTLPSNVQPIRKRAESAGAGEDISTVGSHTFTSKDHVVAVPPIKPIPPSEGNASASLPIRRISNMSMLEEDTAGESSQGQSNMTITSSSVKIEQPEREEGVVNEITPRSEEVQLVGEYEDSEPIPIQHHSMHEYDDMNIPQPDLHKPPSYFKPSTGGNTHQPVEYLFQEMKPAHLRHGSNASSIMGRKMSGLMKTTGGKDITSNTNHEGGGENEQTFTQPLPGSVRKMGTTVQDYKEMEAYMKHRNNAITNLNTHPKNVSKMAKFKHFATPTNQYKNYITFKGQDLEASLAGDIPNLRKAFNIHAPHASESRNVNTLRKAFDYSKGLDDYYAQQLHVTTDQERIPADTLMSDHRHYHDISYMGTTSSTNFSKRPKSPGSPPQTTKEGTGTNFAKITTHEKHAVYCFGDYCAFHEKGKELIEVDETHLPVGEENGVLKEHVKEEGWNIDKEKWAQTTASKWNSNTLRSSRPTTPSQRTHPSTIPSALHNPYRKLKNPDCPFRLTYKSILLTRAEELFLGHAFDNQQIDSLLHRLRLHNLDTEQLYTFFIRKHIQTIIEKCREEARKYPMPSSQRVYSDWYNTNAIYRRMIYDKALVKIHPTRFYYTVPLCETCYKIYSNMEILREENILTLPDREKIAIQELEQEVRESVSSVEQQEWLAKESFQDNSLGKVSRKKEISKKSSGARRVVSAGATRQDSHSLKPSIPPHKRPQSASATFTEAPKKSPNEDVADGNKPSSNKLRLMKLLQQRKALLSEAAKLGIEAELLLKEEETRGKNDGLVDIVGVLEEEELLAEVHDQLPLQRKPDEDEESVFQHLQDSRPDETAEELDSLPLTANIVETTASKHGKSKGNSSKSLQSKRSTTPDQLGYIVPDPTDPDAQIMYYNTHNLGEDHEEDDLFLHHPHGPDRVIYQHILQQHHDKLKHTQPQQPLKQSETKSTGYLRPTSAASSKGSGLQAVKSSGESSGEESIGHGKGKKKRPVSANAVLAPSTKLEHAPELSNAAAAVAANVSIGGSKSHSTLPSHPHQHRYPPPSMFVPAMMSEDGEVMDIPGDTNHFGRFVIHADGNTINVELDTIPTDTMDTDNSKTVKSSNNNGNGKASPYAYSTLPFTTDAPYLPLPDTNNTTTNSSSSSKGKLQEMRAKLSQSAYDLYQQMMSTPSPLTNPSHQQLDAFPTVPAVPVPPIESTGSSPATPSILKKTPSDTSLQGHQQATSVKKKVTIEELDPLPSEEKQASVPPPPLDLSVIGGGGSENGTNTGTGTAEGSLDYSHASSGHLEGGNSAAFSSPTVDTDKGTLVFELSPSPTKSLPTLTPGGNHHVTFASPSKLAIAAPSPSDISVGHTGALDTTTSTLSVSPPFSPLTTSYDEDIDRLHPQEDDFLEESDLHAISTPTLGQSLELSAEEEGMAG